jgi:hypothetical protein
MATLNPTHQVTSEGSLGFPPSLIIISLDLISVVRLEPYGHITVVCLSKIMYTWSQPGAGDFTPEAVHFACQCSYKARSIVEPRFLCNLVQEVLFLFGFESTMCYEFMALRCGFDLQERLQFLCSGNEAFGSYFRSIFTHLSWVQIPHLVFYCFIAFFVFAFCVVSVS